MGRAFAARHGARLGTFRPPGIRQACAPEAAGHCRHQWPCAGWRIGTCHHRGHSYLRGSGQDWSARMRARNDPWLVRYSAPGPAIGRQRSATPREESRHGRNRFSDRLSIHSEPYCGGGGRWQARALRKNGTPLSPSFPQFPGSSASIGGPFLRRSGSGPNSARLGSHLDFRPSFSGEIFDGTMSFLLGCLAIRADTMGGGVGLVRRRAAHG